MDITGALIGIAIALSWRNEAIKPCIARVHRSYGSFCNQGRTAFGFQTKACSSSGYYSSPNLKSNPVP